MSHLKSNNEFFEWINALKRTIKSARQKLAATLNTQVLELYWEIGKEISSKQNTWVLNIIENVAKELNSEFPDMKGFSRRNLYAIRQWYLFYNSKYEFVPRTVAQIPWGHNRLIISKIKFILPFFFLDEKESKNQGSEFLFCSQISVLHIFTTRCEQF